MLADDAALSTAVGAVVGAGVLAVATATGRLFFNYRGTKRSAKQSVATTLAEHKAALDVLAPIPAEVSELKETVSAIHVGLFGEDTHFGRRKGFVEKVTDALDTLLHEATTNGGESMKDVSNAMGKFMAREDDDGSTIS